MKYSSEIKRLIAAILDSFVVAIIILIGGVIILLPLTFFIRKDNEDFIGILFFLLGCVYALYYLAIIYLYNVFYPLKNNGQTPIKKLMGMRVIRVDGQPLTTKVLLLRVLIYYILGIISGITIFFNDEKKTIHDHVANTIVVDL